MAKVDIDFVESETEWTFLASSGQWQRKQQRNKVEEDQEFLLF